MRKERLHCVRVYWYREAKTNGHAPRPAAIASQTLVHSAHPLFIASAEFWFWVWSSLTSPNSDSYQFHGNNSPNIPSIAHKYWFKDFYPEFCRNKNFSSVENFVNLILSAIWGKIHSTASYNYKQVPDFKSSKLFYDSTHALLLLFR